MVAPPEDPEGETERTFDFIRQVKRVNPRRGDHRLHLHAAAAPTAFPNVAAPEARAAARRARRARRVSEDARGVDGAPLGGLRLPRRRALAQRSAAAAHPRFRHRAALPIPDRAGHALAAAGRKAALRTLASWRYSLRRYDRPWELDGLAEPHRPARSARDEHLSAEPPCTSCKSASSSIRSAARPRRLLRDWYPLVDIAVAVASAGERVTVVQASMVARHGRASAASTFTSWRRTPPALR